ncbi:MAG: hypothetical protein ACR2GD_08520 [Pyrinomonadaceae bacterium]
MNNIKNLLLILFCLLSPVGIMTQSDSLAKQQEALKKLDFLVGNWQGAGWIMLGQGKRETFTINETVQSKVNGTVLLVEGAGKNAENKLVHNALAVLSFDAEKQNYRWHAFTLNGNSVEVIPQVSDKKFVWGFRLPQGETRFTITLNEKGNWFEIGEFLPDGGKNWFKNFEMELKKVS